MDSKNEELIFQDELAQTLHKAVLGEPEWDPVMAGACRKAACDGLVLLKNEGVLPLDKQSSTAYFGRVQNDYFYVGYGSGGDGEHNRAYGEKAPENHVPGVGRLDFRLLHGGAELQPDHPGLAGSQRRGSGGGERGGGESRR